jgi:hypothetical protein
MNPARKITVEIPQDLLEKAQQASGAGVTQTVRAGLQLLAASRAYTELRQLRGKVRFSRTLAEIKARCSSRPTASGHAPAGCEPGCWPNARRPAWAMR